MEYAERSPQLLVDIVLSYIGEKLNSRETCYYMSNGAKRMYCTQETFSQVQNSIKLSGPSESGFHISRSPLEAWICFVTLILGFLYKSSLPVFLFSVHKCNNIRFFSVLSNIFLLCTSVD